MSSCSACGSPLVRDSSGFLKCSTCGLLYPHGQTKPHLQNYAKPPNVELPTAKEEEPQDPDMIVFVNRVAQKLIPVSDEHLPEIKAKLSTVRNQYRKELKEVLNGKESMEKWFNRTRRNLGLHAIDLTKILYESLEGLNSVEAKNLRMEYEKALQRIIGVYRPTM